MNEQDREIFLLHTCESLSATEIQKILDRYQNKVQSLRALTEQDYLALGFSHNKAVHIVKHIQHFNIDEIIEMLLMLNIDIITRQHPSYPALLQEIYDPPHILFTKGHLRNDIPLISIVGTRHPTAYGTQCTKTMTATLTGAGFGIVSGLAHGVDSVAHQETLRTKGYTVGVLAHGHARCTPREHRLAQDIVDSDGAIISEHLPHTHAQKHFFPIRNRIIAGMSRATLITEAMKKSGSMVTAACATRENRDVLTVPGLITNPYAEGPHTLITEGAACIHSKDALLEALGISHNPAQPSLPPPSLSSQEANILRIVKREPQHLDDLLESTNMPLHALMRSLRVLQGQNLIKEQHGNTYISI